MAGGILLECVQGLCITRSGENLIEIGECFTCNLIALAGAKFNNAHATCKRIGNAGKPIRGAGQYEAIGPKFGITHRKVLRATGYDVDL